MTNALNVFDFTVSCECHSRDDVQDFLEEYCKKWCYQLERGEHTGYLHYQGRLSLITKLRLNTFKHKLSEIGMKMTISVTSGGCAGDENFDTYVGKLDTRVEGPWRHTDEPPVQMPWQYDFPTPLPLQADIIARIKLREARITNVLYDPFGDNGKSALAAVIELRLGGVDMPPLTEFKDLVALACDIVLSKRAAHKPDPTSFIFDLPRSIPKDKLQGVYAAIEQIKKGKLYDCRNKYKSCWIGAPATWVFTNVMPDPTYLSTDRWRFWTVSSEKRLVSMPPTEALNIWRYQSRLPAESASAPHSGVQVDLAA